MKKKNSKFYVIWICFIIYALFLTFLFQGKRGLFDPDEGRYVLCAKEMIDTKEFLIPKIFGSFHLSKPPFTYWAIAFGLSIFGNNEFGARFFCALSFFGTCIVLAFFGKIFLENHFILPSLIYITSLWPYITSNIVTTDTLLTFFETLALLFFWKGYKDERKRSIYLSLMWFFFSLGFLTKGPAVFPPMLSIFIFLFIKREKDMIKKIFGFRNLLIFFIFGLSWYIFISFKVKGSFSYMLDEMFIGRIFKNKYHRNPSYLAPFYMYLPILLFGLLPWTLFLKDSIKEAIKSKTIPPFSLIVKDETKLFLSLWFFVPLFIFWFAKSHLPLYILPLFPPLSIALGIFIKDKILPFDKRKVLYILTWSIFLLSIRFFSSLYPYPKDSKKLFLGIIKKLKNKDSKILVLKKHPIYGLIFYGRDKVIFCKSLGNLRLDKNKSAIVVVKKRDFEKAKAEFKKRKLKFRASHVYDGWFALEIYP